MCKRTLQKNLQITPILAAFSAIPLIASLSLAFVLESSILPSFILLINFRWSSPSERAST